MTTWEKSAGSRHRKGKGTQIFQHHPENGCLKNTEAVAMGYDGKERGQQGCDMKKGPSVRGHVPNCRSLEAVLGTGFYLE